jgi:hypothetical protein
VLRFCSGELDALAFQVRGGDETLAAEFLEARVFGTCILQLRLRGDQLRIRGLVGEREIARVEAGEFLAAAHALSGFHAPRNDLAADAETQSRFDAGAHLAGELGRGAGVAGAHRHQLDRTLRRGRRFLAAAGSECDDGDREQGEAQGTVHGVSSFFFLSG